MKKIRINELARELEVKAHEILERLPELRVQEKKTHSSSIDEDVAIKLRRLYGFEVPDLEPSEAEEPAALVEAVPAGEAEPFPAPGTHVGRAVPAEGGGGPAAPAEGEAAPAAESPSLEPPAAPAAPIRPPLAGGRPIHPPVVGAPRPAPPAAPAAPATPAAPSAPAVVIAPGRPVPPTAKPLPGSAGSALGPAPR